MWSQIFANRSKIRCEPYKFCKNAKLKLREYFPVYGISFWLTIGNEKSWWIFTKLCAMHFTINSFPRSVTVAIITYVAINYVIEYIDGNIAIINGYGVCRIFGVIHNNRGVLNIESSCYQISCP